MDKGNRTSGPNRKYLIAAAAVFAGALGGVGLLQFYPPSGPSQGTVAPVPRYVDSLSDVRIPSHGRYVLVDAASARLFMIEDGHVRDSMRVVVGKPEKATPTLDSWLNYTTLNPYWHVPADLARSLIAPRVLAGGSTYLTDRGYEVVTSYEHDAKILPPMSVDWKAVAAGDAKVFVRQRPGPANSLGEMKFGIAQGDEIYLHDTPHKELFAQDARNLSNGCVRLEDAPRLAHWLLGDKYPQGPLHPEQYIAIPMGVPISIAYLNPNAQTQLAALN
jgi:murein L,D-transpeptidase YcbB/YkuD